MTGNGRQTAEERREAVLAAAMESFARGGLDGTSTEEIAEAAGISQPYLFRLFGTKKGLFVVAGDGEGSFRIVTRAFPGDVVEYAMRDRRTGRYFASVTSGFYGPRLMYTDDPAGEWELASGIAFADGDLRRAEGLFRRALAAVEADPTSWHVAHARVRLAAVG